MQLGIYFTQKEIDYIKTREKGYVRGLVTREMGGELVSIKPTGKKARKGTPLQKNQNPNNFCKKCGSVLPYFKGKCKNCG